MEKGTTEWAAFYFQQERDTACGIKFKYLPAAPHFHYKSVVALPCRDVWVKERPSERTRRADADVFEAIGRLEDLGSGEGEICLTLVWIKHAVACW